MNEQVKLSIIMPCYNVADTFERAIESILSQEVNFKYQIIIVDDCSDDGGSKKFDHYAGKYPHISIIRHDKNLGNAMSFYDGLSAAEGDYFCVLDGDDYYTVRDKLQKQVNFLDNDYEREYVAVTHYFLIDLGNGMVNLPGQNFITEFNYIDFLAQKAGYYHTTTYMYRNIFKNSIPEQFKLEAFRGDTPRTALHLMYSNKKIKVLNFVGSAYVFNQRGIWSRLNEKQQFRKQVKIWSDLSENTHSEIEKTFYSKLIGIWNEKILKAKDRSRQYPAISIDTCLDRLRLYTNSYAFSNEARDFIFRGIYCSEFIDSACASLGYVYRVYNKKYVQTKIKKENICIFIGGFNPKGGGIFQEILELIKIYKDHEVHIIGSIPREYDHLAFELIKKHPNAHPYVISNDVVSRMEALSNLYNEIMPVKAYYYASHNDPYSQALMQTGPCKNVTLFSFDHGFVCGLMNPNIDCIVAKRPSDFEMLQKKFGEKVIYVPTWNYAPELPSGLYYLPFREHERLITASAAARFYKIDGKTSFVYIDMILRLLELTKGRHYHFGPIPEQKLEYMKEYLRKNAMTEDSFVNIPWTDNLALSVLKNNVDIFIEPFPTVSYKITLEMLSCGIPVFIHDSIQRVGKVDFIYPGCLTWKTKEEFYNTLVGLDDKLLEEHSHLASTYFNDTHSTETVVPRLKEEEGMSRVLPSKVVDNSIHEIREYLRLYSHDIKVMLVQVMLPISSIKPVRSEQKHTHISKQLGKPVLKKTTKSYFISKYNSVLLSYKNKGFLRTFWHVCSEVFRALKNIISDLWVSLKNFLKAFLPLPARYFYREIAHLKKDFRNAIKGQEEKVREVLVEQKDFRNAIKGQEKKVREVLVEQKDFRNAIKGQEEIVRDTFRYTNEALWANIFNNTIASSSWLIDKSVSPGRWAIGYPCLYVLYKVLDELRPKKILELGLGQSTRIISQYAAANFAVSHYVVEHDNKWLSFFKNNTELPNNTKVITLDTEIIKYNDANDILVFKGFEQRFAGDMFDLIFIDAPYGTKHKEGQRTMSRIDVLRLMPGCLEKSFVIIMDDAGREGEKATIVEMDKVLTDFNVNYRLGKYSGVKEIRLWCSEDNAFLSSL